MLGIPVISTNCKSGPKEILLNGKGGELFNVGDYETLSKKISFFFNNKKTLKKKLIVARKNVARFNIKTVSKEFWNLIEKQ